MNITSFFNKNLHNQKNLDVHNLKNKETKSNLNANKNDKEDIVEISKEALEANIKLIEENQNEEKLKEEIEKNEAEIKHLKAEAEKAKAEMEAASKFWKTFGKCLTIAIRLMRGDEVPKLDEKFLMKNDNKLYCKAITLRNNIKMLDNKKGEKQKSVLDKEERRELLEEEFKRIFKIENNIGEPSKLQSDSGLENL